MVLIGHKKARASDITDDMTLTGKAVASLTTAAYAQDRKFL